MNAERALTLGLAALAGAASAALSAAAGWFLASAALVGAMGPLAAHAFNFLAPSAAVRLFAMLRTGARYAERVVGHDAVLGQSARLRPRLFLALAQRNSWREAGLEAGDIDARIMRDAETAEAELVQQRAPLWSALGAGAAAALAAAFAGWQVALVVLAAFALAAWAAPALGAALSRGAARALADRRARLRALCASAEAGVDELRALRAAPHMAALLEQQAGAVAEAELRLARAAIAAGAVAALAWTLALLTIVLRAQSGAADWPVVVAALLACLALSEQAAPLVEVRVREPERELAKARVRELLDAARGEPATAAPQPPWDIAVAGFAALGDNAKPLRPPVSFAVQPGAVVVLRARSGAGKTTLLKLLLGQTAPALGEVAIGAAAPSARADLGALIAYLPQSVDLLPGSVRDNLRLAAPAAADAEIWEALRRAAVDGAVRLAGGLDAPISALGEGFSGGESRRVALARAFLSQRPLVLLDEPTEGLDAETEAKVAAAIVAHVREQPGRLALIVSHRSALAQLADHCVDLDAALQPAVH